MPLAQRFQMEFKKNKAMDTLITAAFGTPSCTYTWLSGKLRIWRIQEISFGMQKSARCRHLCIRQKCILEFREKMANLGNEKTCFGEENEERKHLKTLAAHLTCSRASRDVKLFFNFRVKLETLNKESRQFQFSASKVISHLQTFQFKSCSKFMGLLLRDI